jgi:lysophospholipase L1-like esterase
MNNRGRLRGSWFCLLISLIAACGGNNFAKIRNIRSDGWTIIFFGDSLTEGVDAESGEDYLSVLSRELGLPVINTASAGDTTAEALARIFDAVLSKNLRLVIVLLGGNDFCARWHARRREKISKKSSSTYKLRRDGGDLRSEARLVRRRARLDL